MTEFDLIKNYFATQALKRTDVQLSIGDDAAIVTLTLDQQLAITTDTLVAGTHFLEDTHAHDIGYKALAVNLSDLAAMGARPAWMTLALTLPKPDESWIQDFCTGFFTLANRYQVQLIGGDLTKGPLSITIQAMGLLPKNKALRRDHAKPGDLIYVTGTLGDAGLALEFLREKISIAEHYQSSILEKLHRPEPRIATGEAILSLANAAIDISDGLLADLGHILEASKVGADIYVDKLPLSEALTHSVSAEQILALALTAGDDYELCFTIPANSQAVLEKKLSAILCRYTCIGQIKQQLGLDVLYPDGKKYHGNVSGFQHF